MPVDVQAARSRFSLEDMSAEPPDRRDRATTVEVQLALADLRGGPSLRANGLDPAHVALLAEMANRWPAIVVHRADFTVIDGQHRVAAARQLGLHHVRAVLFDGSPDDAYVEFVRCNVGHGLPLSLEERRAAVQRILRTHADRSDRGIAEVCGVSPKTVARVPRRIPRLRWTGNERHPRGSRWAGPTGRPG